MNKNSLTSISTLGEFGLIQRLTEKFIPKQESTLKGVGDDAAVLEYGNTCLVVTTDLLIENVHFDLMYMPLKHLGYKSVIVNLSDIYAMNAQPRQITVSLAISNRFTVEALDELYEGIRLACEHHQVDLIGGDTTSSTKGMCISITAIGEAQKHNIVYRNTACEGDLICVSGNLGAAYMGLQLLEREKEIFKSNPNMQPELTDWSYIVGRQLKPQARADIIEMLRTADIKPNSMIDISDGLSSEIIHICMQSQKGCRIIEDKIPIDLQTRLMAKEFHLDPSICALNGGEDYELLFTIKQSDFPKLQNVTDITIIGNVTSQTEGLYIVLRDNSRVPLTAQGWNALLTKDLN